MTSETLTAIMEVTTRCNCSCSYCYVDAGEAGVDMAMETVRTAIEKLLSLDGYEAVRFIWHGGEPLLRGLEFFEEVVELQQGANTRHKTYTNAIQTNGTLLSDESLHFFKKNSFHVGLSLDGPREVHDLTRRSHGGEGGTHEVTMDRIRLLKEHSLAAGAIATITARNSRRPDDFYRFFQDNGIHLKLGPLRKAGRAKSLDEALRLLPEEYGRFAVRLLELWLSDKESRVTISPFDSICRSMVMPEERGPTECVYSGECHSRFVGLAPNGDIYPCGLYQGHSDFRYGNIHEMGIGDIRHTPAYRVLESRQAAIRLLCGGCAFLEHCHGGCPFSALTGNGTVLAKDYYCDAFRMVFERVAESRETLGESRDLEERVRLMFGGGGGGGSYTVHVDEPYSVYVDYSDYQVLV